MRRAAFILFAAALGLFILGSFFSFLFNRLIDDGGPMSIGVGAAAILGYGLGLAAMVTGVVFLIVWLARRPATATRAGRLNRRALGISGGLFGAGVMTMIVGAAIAAMSATAADRNTVVRFFGNLPVSPGKFSFRPEHSMQDWSVGLGYWVAGVLVPLGVALAVSGLIVLAVTLVRDDAPAPHAPTAREAHANTSVPNQAAETTSGPTAPPPPAATGRPDPEGASAD